MNTPEILFEEIPGVDGNLGLITLNRPQVLNALNHSMFIMLHQQLKQWKNDSQIKAVIIRAAEGRAFCAGGDIRSAYERKQKKDSSLHHLFRDEYRLNAEIHHYPKPYIALLDGITMGGGAGVSIHGSHRVATERLVFAMPETAIGFFPDVGASYFLSRLPEKIGIYLGLTGQRISASDCIALNLATHFVSRDSLTRIIEKLANTSLRNETKNTVTTILNQFSIPTEKSNLLELQNKINAYFSENSVENIIHALEKNSNAWEKETLAILKTKSPTSLKVTLLAFQKGMRLDFDACMQMEYRLVHRFLQGHDFFEGIRAAIIDKDQAPHWQPASLENVSNQEIEKYFLPLKEELV